jgi:hypothetical protein
MNGSVVQRDDKLTTRSNPRAFGFPNVNVLIATESQSASTGSEGFGYVYAWIIRAAIQRHGVWVIGSKDI